MPQFSLSVGGTDFFISINKIVNDIFAISQQNHIKKIGKRFWISSKNMATAEYYGMIISSF